jgi:hypothetical protein
MTARHERIPQTPCKAISLARRRHCLDPPRQQDNHQLLRPVGTLIADWAVRHPLHCEGGGRGCPTREAGKLEGRATGLKADLLILAPLHARFR